MVRHITSPDNGEIKKISSLLKKKYRDQLGLFMTEGRNGASECLVNKADVKTVAFTEEFRDARPENGELVERLVSIADDALCVTSRVFSALTDAETPQEILAVVKKPEYSEEEFYCEGAGEYIVLDRLQDPGNIGTILRTADAAGFKGAVVIKGTADIFSPKIVRAAAGSLFRVPLRFLDGPDEAIRELKARGRRVICTSPRAARVYYDVKLCDDAAVVIGNEANGASVEFLENSDQNILIPMSGPVESLNASVSAAVIMYEAVRQRLCR